MNFWLDTSLLAAFLLLLWAATVRQFVFPAGPDAWGWSLWGWDYSQWAQFEYALLCLLALGILVHVMLHWSWVTSVGLRLARGKSAVKGKSKMDEGIQTLVGVGVLIVILHALAIGVAAAALTMTPP